MKNLIILEMANNHSGDLEHGKKIIEKYSKICLPYFELFEFVFKFQYRDLDTFIRPDMKSDINIPLIKRFSDTRLSSKEFKKLIDFSKRMGFGTMVTPFDENSVDLAIKHNVEYLKIASCSFGDWPLLEKISEVNKKIVASCAGATLQTIENVVIFFRNRKSNFRLQHCVGEYPTIDENLNVNQVFFLKNKFPELEIGFSSHEDPTRTNIAPLALALGATSFEKHVALETSNIKKNAYSTSPEEFELWLESLINSHKILGTKNIRYIPNPNESDSLRNLQRGIFAKKDLDKNTELSIKDIFFAFPPSESQLTANDFSKYSKFILKSKKYRNEPIFIDDTLRENVRQEIKNIVDEISNLIKSSNLIIPSHADLEISHHYGLHNFKKFGLTIITVVNREYCKKVLILLPGQAHPEQFHKKKEETFHVIWGEGKLKINEKIFNIKVGDIHTILPMQKHYFESNDKGLIIEEISSTHFKNDSFYTDKNIMENEDRKTLLTHWRIS